MDFWAFSQVCIWLWRGTKTANVLFPLQPGPLLREKPLSLSVEGLGWSESQDEPPRRLFATFVKEVTLHYFPPLQTNKTDREGWFLTRPSAKRSAQNLAWEVRPTHCVSDLSDLESCVRSPSWHAKPEVPDTTKQRTRTKAFQMTGRLNSTLHLRTTHALHQHNSNSCIRNLVPLHTTSSCWVRRPHVQSWSVPD